jgi:hypothetical protein
MCREKLELRKLRMHALCFENVYMVVSFHKKTLHWRYLFRFVVRAARGQSKPLYKGDRFVDPVTGQACLAKLFPSMRIPNPLIPGS